jgi:mevalonate kinase
MSSRGRINFGGPSISTQKASRRSSSTTSTQIDTPSDTESCRSSIDMPPKVAVNGSANGATNGMEKLKVNGEGKKNRMPNIRKQSSAMLPPFIVSAPGKVIVFGEHAVVHGKVSSQ